jgi:DNA helicase-2/ATP-dependent DNA helicase PcrA
VGAWAERNQALCLYGDVSQSLYSWRSAEPEYILRFHAEPGVETYLLPTNYRSVPKICTVATRLVLGKKWHLVGEIQPARQAAGASVGEPPVVLREFASQGEELSWALGYAAAEERRGKVVIIARTSGPLHYLELRCIKQEIPYIKRGGRFMFDAKECRDMLAYLTVVGGLPDEDNVALRRVLRAPPCYIKKEDMDYCQTRLRGGQTLIQALLGYDKLPWYAKRNVLRRKDLLIELGDGRPAQVIERVVQKTKYLEWLAEEVGLDADEGDVGSAMIEALQEAAEPFETISEFVKFVEGARRAAEQNKGRGQAVERQDVVLLTTVHGVKGGQAEEVIIVDVTQRHFPTFYAEKADPTSGQMDEELRCLYVALTRAKDRVFVTWNKSSGPSRFVDLLRRVLTVRND